MSRRHFPIPAAAGLVLTGGIAAGCFGTGGGGKGGGDDSGSPDDTGDTGRVIASNRA